LDGLVSVRRLLISWFMVPSPGVSSILTSELRCSVGEYDEYLGAANLLLAVFALAWGIATAYRQTREGGPVAVVVPTLPFGVEASLLLTFSLAFLRVELPWWGYAIVFPGTALLFPAVIYAVGRRPPLD
jgi:hypothetical protein